MIENQTSSSKISLALKENIRKISEPKVSQRQWEVGGGRENFVSIKYSIIQI